MALSDNLQGWWCPSLDTAGNGTTTLTDLSGNGNNGTLTNMDAATDWVADTDSGGVRALDFNGSSQRVVMGSAALPLTGNFTLSFWFLYRDNTIDGLVSQYTIGTAGRTAILINQNEGGGVTSNSLNCFHPDLRMSEFGLSVDTWQHVVLQRSSNQGLLYVNGALQDTDTDWSTAIQDTSFVLGALDATGLNSLNGRIDAVAVYDRVLAADEVAQLYNGGRSLRLTNLSTGLQGWWCPSLDTAGNGTTTLTDLSGNGNNGTLTDMDAATDWVADTDSGGMRALDFDGVNDRIAAFSDGIVNRVIEGDTWTVAFWSKPLAVNVALSFSDVSATNRWNAFYPTNNGMMQCNRLGASAGSQVFQSSTTPVLTGEWALFTYCFSASGMLMYHNATPLTVSMQNGTNTGSTYTSGQLDTINFAALERSSGVLGFLKQLLDGVMVYDRVLTADEVSQLYNGGRSLNLLTSGGSGNIAHVLRSMQQQHESVVVL